MAKPGRKRRNVEREPNGRAMRSGQRDETMATVLAYRRKSGVPEAELQNQMAECIIGRMVLNGRLEDYHYEAAKRYEQVWRSYRVYLDAPRGDVANDMASVHGRPVLDEAQLTERDIAAKEAGQAVIVALVGADLEYGDGAGEVLVNAVLNGIEPHERGFGLLRGALETLAVHFGTKTDPTTNKQG